MDNQVTTIVCPNCGAHATNLHNCEFCGSFLVQKAALGVDMAGYLQKAKEYYSAGVEKVLQTYCSILAKHSLHDGLYLTFDRDNVALVSIEPTSENGVTIRLLESILAEKGLVNRFKNSNVFEAFTVTEGWVMEETGEVSGTEVFKADFGADYAGAALVVNQLLKDIFQVSLDDIVMKISGGLDASDEAGNEVESHFATYNKNGVFLYGRGDGKNQFETIEGIKNNLAIEAAIPDKAAEPMYKKKSKQWIWSLVGILIYLIIKIIIINS